ncbi:hypothetical protein BJ742DRAFT_857526 [Cladochytrium replicatum]|nr:hypothetical protein BJ742DRAFT_857526 [Cladochytrium replicatum]
MLIIGPLATTTVITSKDAFELRDVPLKGILPFVLMILITDRHLVPKVDLRERMKHLLAYSALSLSFAGFIIASIALRQRLGTPLEIVMSSIGLVMYPLTMIVISAIQFNRPIKRMLRDLQSAQRAASYFFTPNSDQTGSGKRGNIGVRFNRSEKYADDLHPKMMRYTEKNNPLQMLLATYNFVLAVTVILWVAAITVHILSEVRGARTAFERTIWSLILLLESSVESFVKLWADWNECSMSDVEDMSVDLTSNRPIERSESVQPELLRQPHTISTLGINSALTYVPHASGHVFNPSRRGSFLHSDRSVRGNSNIVIDEKLVSFELNGNGQSSSQTLDRSGAKISLESPLLTTSPYQLGNGRGEPSMGNSGPYLSPYQLVPTDRRRYIPSSPKPPRRISEGFQGDTYRD